MTAPLTMAVLPAVAARPETSAAPPDASADGGGASSFATALQVARRPAAGSDKAKAGGDTGSEQDGKPGDKADEAATTSDPTQPDLTGLLPGWPAQAAPVAAGTATAARAAGKARAGDSDVAAVVASDATHGRERLAVDGTGSALRDERREGKASSAPSALASLAPTTPNSTAHETTPRITSATAEAQLAQPAAGDIDVRAVAANPDSSSRESRAVDGGGAGSTQHSEHRDGNAAAAPSLPATFAAAASSGNAREIATRSASSAVEALRTQPTATANGSDPSLAANPPTPAGAALAPRETMANIAPPAAPFQAHLAAALDSPAFAPALATQVKWLVNEGVQQARLSLNPTEMGPVAVQIVLDGTQARVDFSADMASTRAAIEASLPMLAAALHDSGLTLAGGGVFDGQARHGAHGQHPSGPAQPRADAATAATAGEKTATMPMRARRGLVDLVA